MSSGARKVGVELSRRRHHVSTLTSGRCASVRPCSDPSGIDVYRRLHLEVDSGLLESTLRLAVSRRWRERQNLDSVRQVVDSFRPDVVLVWGMWNVPRSVPALVEELLGDRVAYYLCDYWPSLPSAYLQQWQSPPRRAVGRLPKWLIGRPVVARLNREPTIELRLEHPICVSQAVREVLVRAGVPWPTRR